MRPPRSRRLQATEDHARLCQLTDNLLLRLVDEFLNNLITKRITAIQTDLPLFFHLLNGRSKQKTTNHAANLSLLAGKFGEIHVSLL
jgi:hypothetical protein